MEDSDPIIARDGILRSVILSVIVLYAAIVLLFSDRPLLIGSKPWIMPGASIKLARAPRGYLEALDQYGVHSPKLRHPPLYMLRAPVLRPPSPNPIPVEIDTLHFGYSIVETSILGAPYWLGKDDGYVVYYEMPDEFVYAPVTDDYLRQVKLPGPKPLSSQSFAWWAHVWGWVFPLALGGWGWFEIGAMRRRREALGLI
jgi:hypothetical protein